MARNAFAGGTCCLHFLALIRLRGEGTKKPAEKKRTGHDASYPGNLLKPSINNGWKENIPKVWRRSGKLNRNQRTFRTKLRRTWNLGFHYFFGSDVFDGDLGALRQRF